MALYFEELTVGIVEFEHEMFNQRDEMVAFCRRAAMMHRKPVEDKDNP